MKCFASLVFVLALGIVAGAGCSESRPNLCAGAPCDDGNGCTDDVCDPSDGSCSNVPLEDGAFCDIGYCQNGECDAIDSVFDCSEQGIRDAIAAGGGPHAFDCDGATVVRTEDVIVIDNDVTLDGLGELTIHGNDAHTVVIVEADAKAELVRITVSNGSDVGLEWGIGGIQNLGTLAMTNCIVRRPPSRDLRACCPRPPWVTATSGSTNLHMAPPRVSRGKGGPIPRRRSSRRPCCCGTRSSYSRRHGPWRWPWARPSAPVPSPPISPVIRPA